MNENQPGRDDPTGRLPLSDLIQLGRQQRALALSAAETRLQLEASRRTQQHQALLDALRSAVTAQLPEALYPYVDWDALSLDEWHNEYTIDIDVPECALITIKLSKEDVDTWAWDGRYTILVPDHVEYDYEDGYSIHYDRQVETEPTLALAIAADAHPRLAQLQAERKAIEAGRLDRMHDDETRLEQEAADEENQSAALLHILDADPVLRAFFHAVIAYRSAQASWDAQLSQQYADMQALEQRYARDLQRQREDANAARVDLLDARARVTELEDQVSRLQRAGS